MSNEKYVLPSHVLRNDEPKEIVVDGVKLRVRELSPLEYANLIRSETIKIGDTVSTKSTYGLRLIESCVIEPEIKDANILTAAFAGNLAHALDVMMGNIPEAEIKNG